MMHRFSQHAFASSTRLVSVRSLACSSCSSLAPYSSLASSSASSRLPLSSFTRSSNNNKNNTRNNNPIAFPSSPLRRTAFTYPSSRTLDEIVQLPKLILRTPEEIKMLWSAHHNLARNAATFPDFLASKEFDTLGQRAKTAPLFVVPSFRLANSSPAQSEPFTFNVDDGFEMMIVNVQQNSLLLTSVEEYKVKGASEATPYAVITLYSDMAASKDLVLVRGEMMDVNVQLPQLQAMWHLLKQLYIFDEANYNKFPFGFNKKPNPQLDFDAYISWCKNHIRDLKLPQTKFTLETEGGDVPAAEFVTQDEVKEEKKQ